MGHDPERSSAAYLGGVLGPAERAEFERHLLDCDECWRDVALARQGRAAAESLREVAPAALRDRVRAVVELDVERPGAVTASQTRRRQERRQGQLRRAVRPPGRALVVAVTAVLVLALAGVAAVVLPGAPVAPGAPGGPGGPGGSVTAAEPPVVTAVVAAYEDPTTLTSAGDLPARPARLGGMPWAGSGWGASDGQSFVVHRYADDAGHVLLLAETAGSFGHPSTAVAAAGLDWVADVSGVTVVCVSAPAPVLVVGDDPRQVRDAAAALKVDQQDQQDQPERTP